MSGYPASLYRKPVSCRLDYGSQAPASPKGGSAPVSEPSLVYPNSLWVKPKAGNAAYPATLYRQTKRRNLWARARLATAAVTKWRDTTKTNIYNEDWLQEEGAAATIQRLFRFHTARTHRADDRMWETFKSLDEAQEWQTVTRIEKMKQLQIALCDIAGVSVSMERGLPCPKAFPCPTAASIQAMIQGFRQGNVLPMTDAIPIIEAAIVMFSSESTVMHVRTEGDTTVVVGDLHGSLYDLLHILDTYGLPGPDNRLRYVFNGDLVDRGEHSCEVLLIVVALKLFVPDSVYINRGNHEDSEVNVFYGFVDECREKYDFGFYRLCSELFDYLPLVTCLDRQVCILHGGLSSEGEVSLSEIASFTRGPDFLTLRSDRQVQIISDILWSDPQKRDSATGSVYNPRGKGVLFGVDVTESFLEQNGLKLLVRSHEEQKTGYKIHHKGLIVTVFSVSNYAGHGNGAAVLVFDSKSTKPRVHKWLPPEAKTKKKEKNDCSRLESMSKYIEESIVEHQDALMAYWSNIDKQGTHYVSIEDWERGMDDELRLPRIPTSVRTQLLHGVVRDYKEVHYRKFLQAHKIRYEKKLAAYGSVLKWHNEAVVDLAEHLGNSVDDFAKAFESFDTSHTGTLSFAEFKSAVRKVVSFDMLSDHQVETLAQAFDGNGDGQIGKEEFIQRLSSSSPKAKPISMEWSTDRRQERLKELQKKLRPYGKEGVEAALRKHDQNGDGRMDSDELAIVLQNDFNISYQSTLFKDLFGILGGDDVTDTANAMKVATKRPFPVSKVSIEAHHTNRNHMYFGVFGVYTEYEITVECDGADPWTVRHRFSNFESLKQDLAIKDPLPPSSFPITSEAGRQKRRVSLEAWLQKVVSQASRNRKARNPLRVFLRVPYGDHDKYIRTQTHTGTINISTLASALCPDVSLNSADQTITPALGSVLLSLLYKYRLELKHVFHVRDEDGSGQINIEDFRTTLLSLNELEGHPLTRAQLDKLVQRLDKNRDGVIDYKEFEHAVRPSH